MLARANGETDAHYHKRLIYGKLDDKTLQDIDYTELAPLVYGKDYSADVARRMFYGSYKTLKLLESEPIAPTEIEERINAQRTELEKEKQRFYDQRREYKKLVSEAGRREHLENRLVEAAGKLPNTVGELKFCERYCDEEENEAILVLSDWHYGMVASNMFNTYNTDICRLRVAAVVERAVESAKLHRCGTMHVVVLGDLFHGAIHTSARVQSEELVCDQLMQVSEILAQALGFISSNIPNVRVYMTYGNHARTVQQKSDSVHEDNMERIIPWWLKQRLACNTNIVFSDSPYYEFIYLNVCGHGFVASHGDLDGIRSLPRLIPGLFKNLPDGVDYVLVGDKHHDESFSELGVKAMVVGALCGTDDYANEKRLYTDPEQLLLIVNKDDGASCEYHLKCK